MSYKTFWCPLCNAIAMLSLAVAGFANNPSFREEYGWLAWVFVPISIVFLILGFAAHPAPHRFAKGVGMGA